MLKSPVKTKLFPLIDSLDPQKEVLFKNGELGRGG